MNEIFFGRRYNLWYLKLSNFKNSLGYPNHLFILMIDFKLLPCLKKKSLINLTRAFVHQISILIYFIFYYHLKNTIQNYVLYSISLIALIQQAHIVIETISAYLLKNWQLQL